MPAVATADLYFAIVPEWLIDADISDRAFRLYTLLARYADSDGTNAIPSRRTLAERLRCSVDTIDRATTELLEAGVIERRHRYQDGRQTSNGYLVRRIGEGLTGAAHEGRTDAAHPGRTDAAPVTESQKDREPKDREQPTPTPSADDPDVGFEEAWLRYPRRNGKRVGKQSARAKWRTLSVEDRRACWTAIGHYRVACDTGVTIAKDMERFLKADYWRDWIDPPETSTNGVHSGQARATVSDWSDDPGGEF